MSLQYVKSMKYLTEQIQESVHSTRMPLLTLLFSMFCGVGVDCEIKNVLSKNNRIIVNYLFKQSNQISKNTVIDDQIIMNYLV